VADVAAPARLAVGLALADSWGLIEGGLGDGIRLALDAGAGLPPVPIAAGDLERVLLNLAGNAREAMPAGGAVAVGAELVTIPPGDARLGTGWHVRIAFADDGCGMSADVAERALEPYFSTKGGAGSGLGLASARAIAAAAGGDLRLNSRPGAGTTIAIYLPALDGDGERLALSPPGA
jgi:signal transduction histidine kinase